MGLRAVQGDVVLTGAAAGAGTFLSGPIANPGAAADVLLMVHLSVVGGTPTLNASLEESNDNSSYTAVPGSAIAQLGTGVGNASSNARITKSYVRVTATVAGGTPAATYRAAVLVIPE